MSNAGRPPHPQKNELTAKAVQLVSEGFSIRQIAAKLDKPKSTICHWLLEAPEYDTALQIRAMQHVDEMREHMADMINGHMDPQIYREVKDSIKWMAGKEMSHRYGDKREINIKEKTINEVLEELPEK